MTTKQENRETARVCKLRDAMDKATKGLSAWVLVKDGRGVGRIVIKWGGRVRWAWAYVDGLGWRYGSAGGYGYDKASAAMVKALPELVTDTGEDWEIQLEKAGYEVIGAI